MIVSKQCNYYDDGAYSVEIAAELDFIGPGALAGSISEVFDDPREAAEYAIQLRKEWIKEGFYTALPFHIPFTLSMNGILYATVNDGLTASGLRRWAKEQYEKLPKCDYCGGFPAQQYTFEHMDDQVVACNEYHADQLHAQNCYVQEEDKDDV